MTAAPDDRVQAFERGRELFAASAPCPPNTWTDEEWCDALNAGQCEWLGWMLERGIKLYREIKRSDAVRDYIEYGVDLPAGFNRERAP